MRDTETASEATRRRRAAWPLVVRELREPVEPQVFGTTASRLRAVVELTEQCWTLARRTVPRYARHETPVRVVRLRPVPGLEK